MDAHNPRTPQDDGCKVEVFAPKADRPILVDPNASPRFLEHFFPDMKSYRSGGQKSPSKTFERQSLSQIMTTEYPELQWAVTGYLAEGLSVLAGRQKLGKTWIALDFSLAIGTGGAALGQISCEQGDVLYLDLENGARRMQRRIEMLFPTNMPDLSRIEIVERAPNLNDGFIGALEHWRTSVENPRLVVIDVLQRIKQAGSNARNAYENDYATFQELQQWAMQNGIAVLGLHHTKKGGADDPLEALSGSNGLSACADSTLVLDRDGNGTTLYVRGRDVSEIETAIRFDEGRWSILGAAEDVRRSSERKEILTFLISAKEPVRPGEIVAALGLKRNNVDQLLYRMVQSNEVEKVGRGLYGHPDNPLSLQPASKGP
ncbi:MAG: AAA family ATPase [Pseudomonadota bacterium]